MGGLTGPAAPPAGPIEPNMPPCINRETGYTAVELMFTTALMVILSGIAVPQMLASVEETRTVGAVRYLAARLQRLRSEAVRRSAVVSMRFASDASGWQFTEYLDGNGNGVLAADIQRGVDRPLAPADRLTNSFRGVDVGVLPGVPSVDAGSPPPDGDPLKLGASNAVSFAPQGSASSGSIYVLGRAGSQYVIRVFGETGKTRILRYDAALRRWMPL
ncbi:MAG TPA: GspH/FimT family pseudopilin [Vicinamibacterales bacterium]|nr:GspH/FimT family pseudopilin [Vicinamibacterales bacterium]